MLENDVEGECFLVLDTSLEGSKKGLSGCLVLPFRWSLEKSLIYWNILEWIVDQAMKRIFGLHWWCFWVVLMSWTLLWRSLNCVVEVFGFCCWCSVLLDEVDKTYLYWSFNGISTGSSVKAVSTESITIPEHFPLSSKSHTCETTQTSHPRKITNLSTSPGCDAISLIRQSNPPRARVALRQEIQTHY